MQIYASKLRSFACSLPVESFFRHWYWRREFWRSSNWRVYQFPPAVIHWAIQSRCRIKVRGKKKHLRKFVMQPVDEFVDSNITLFAVWLKNLNTKWGSYVALFCFRHPTRFIIKETPLKYIGTSSYQNLKLASI